MAAFFVYGMGAAAGHQHICPHVILRFCRASAARAGDEENCLSSGTLGPGPLRFANWIMGIGGLICFFLGYVFPFVMDRG